MRAALHAIEPHPWLQHRAGAATDRPGHRVQPYIQVSIDLTNFTGRTARDASCQAGRWPPDNWGCGAGRCGSTTSTYTTTATASCAATATGASGSTPTTASAEWTKLFDCDGCVHGVESFGGRPGQTGDSSEVANDRSRSPTCCAFRSRRGCTLGFEADGLIDDDTGSVSDLPAQGSGGAPAFYCDDQTISGCASYTLNYQILPASRGQCHTFRRRPECARCLRSRPEQQSALSHLRRDLRGTRRRPSWRRKTHPSRLEQRRHLPRPAQPGGSRL